MISSADSPEELDLAAPHPARGRVAHGFAPLAEQFARHLESGAEIGAGLTVYHHGRCVVDLWGGHADRETRRPWTRDSRVVVFSVTKGFAAMAMHLLADRGQLAWDAPVAAYWPAFAQAGKDNITVAQLLNHRAGLPFVRTRMSLAEICDPNRRDELRELMETQEPLWEPGTDQGYHAITYGMYVRVLFEQITGEDLGGFLRRELFEPLDSDVWVGAPPELDPHVVTLYPVSSRERAVRFVSAGLLRPGSTEGRVFRALTRKGSIGRKAFANAAPGDDGLVEYNRPPARRATLAWASATTSAHGLARAYLPFASGGTHDGTRYLEPETLFPAYRRLSWSQRDLVLQKPLGWSHGFLKEERHVFSPNPESFGHAGMGGALGWCDPIEEIAFGYTLNKMDWKVRSDRAVALCRALYECPALTDRPRASRGPLLK